MERVNAKLEALKATIDESTLLEPQALERMLNFADWFFQHAGAVWLGADVENKIPNAGSSFPNWNLLDLRRVSNPPSRQYFQQFMDRNERRMSDLRHR
jgi:hypothetical protein